MSSINDENGVAKCAGDVMGISQQLMHKVFGEPEQDWLDGSQTEWKIEGDWAVYLLTWRRFNKTVDVQVVRSGQHLIAVCETSLKLLKLCRLLGVQMQCEYVEARRAARTH